MHPSHRRLKKISFKVSQLYVSKMKSETSEGKSLSLYNLQFKSKMVKVLVGKINNYLRRFVSLGLYSKKITSLLV